MTHTWQLKFTIIDDVTDEETEKRLLCSLIHSFPWYYVSLLAQSWAIHKQKPFVGFIMERAAEEAKKIFWPIPRGLLKLNV